MADVVVLFIDFINYDDINGLSAIGPYSPKLGAEPPQDGPGRIWKGHSNNGSERAYLPPTLHFLKRIAGNGREV